MAAKGGAGGTEHGVPLKSLKDCLQFLDWLSTWKPRDMATALVQKLIPYYPRAQGFKRHLQAQYTKFLRNVSALYNILSSNKKTTLGTYEIKANDIVESLLECTPKLLAALSFIQYHVDDAFSGVGGGDWASQSPNSGDFQTFLTTGNNSIGGGFSAGELKNVQGKDLVKHLREILNKEEAARQDHYRNVILTTLGGSLDAVNTGNAVFLLLLFCQLVIDDPSGDNYKSSMEEGIGPSTICWEDLKSHCVSLKQSINALMSAGFSASGRVFKPTNAALFAEKAAKWFRENLTKAAEVLSEMIPHKIDMRALRSFAENKLYPHGFIFDGSKQRVSPKPNTVDEWTPKFQQFHQLENKLRELKTILHGYKCGFKPAVSKPDPPKPTATKTEAAKPPVTTTPTPSAGGNTKGTPNQGNTADGAQNQGGKNKQAPNQNDGRSEEKPPTSSVGKSPSPPSSGAGVSAPQGGKGTQGPGGSVSPERAASPGKPTVKSQQNASQPPPVTSPPATPPGAPAVPSPNGKQGGGGGSSQVGGSTDQKAGGASPTAPSMPSSGKSQVTSSTGASSNSGGNGSSVSGKPGGTGKDTNGGSTTAQQPGVSAQNITTQSPGAKPPGPSSPVVTGNGGGLGPGSQAGSSLPGPQAGNGHGAPGGDSHGQQTGGSAPAKPPTTSVQRTGPQSSGATAPSNGQAGSPGSVPTSGPGQGGHPGSSVSSTVSGKDQGSQGGGTKGPQPAVTSPPVQPSTLGGATQVPQSSSVPAASNGPDTGVQVSTSDTTQLGGQGTSQSSTNVATTTSSGSGAGGGGGGGGSSGNSNTCPGSITYNFGSGDTNYCPRNGNKWDLSAQQQMHEDWDQKLGKAKKDANERARQHEEEVRKMQQHTPFLYEMGITAVDGESVPEFSKMSRHPISVSGIQRVNNKINNAQDRQRQMLDDKIRESKDLKRKYDAAKWRSQQIDIVDKLKLAVLSPHIRKPKYADPALIEAKRWSKIGPAITFADGEPFEQHRDNSLTGHILIGPKDDKDRFSRAIGDVRGYPIKPPKTKANTRASLRSLKQSLPPAATRKPNGGFRASDVQGTVLEPNQQGEKNVHGNTGQQTKDNMPLPLSYFMADGKPVKHAYSKKWKPRTVEPNDIYTMLERDVQGNVLPAIPDILSQPIPEPKQNMRMPKLDNDKPYTPHTRIKDFVQRKSQSQIGYFDDHPGVMIDPGICPASYSNSVLPIGITIPPTDTLNPPPRTVRQMLCWLSDLPSAPGFAVLTQLVASLFSNSKTIASSEQLSDNDVITTMYDACGHASSVLAGIQGSNYTDLSKFHFERYGVVLMYYSEDPYTLLCQLLGYVYAACHQLSFLRTQCSRDTHSGGWRDCQYGENVMCSATWQCTQFPADIVKSHHHGCDPSPLQGFLTDHLDLSTYWYERDNICRRSHIKMGFQYTDLPSKSMHGFYIYQLLIGACYTADPLEKLCRYLVYLTRRTPRTTGELVSYFHNFGIELHGYASESLTPLGTALRNSHLDCPDWDRLDLIGLQAVRGIRGQESLISKHNSSHDIDHPRTLSTLVGCGSDSANCHPRMFPITYRAYALYSQRFAHTYLSWAVYLPDRLWESLEKLRYDFKKHVSMKCSSLYLCSTALPLLYTHGITPPEGKSQLTVKCSDVISKLEEIVNGGPIATLMTAMDNFLYGIREPFIFTLVALWSTAFLIFANTMLYRLDVLHIRSHLIRTKASHHIDVKAILTKGRKMLSLYKDVDYFDDDPIGQLSF